MNVLYRINKKGEFEKHYGFPADEMISGYDLKFFYVPKKRKNCHETFYCSPRPMEVIGNQYPVVWFEEENDAEARRLLLSYELERMAKQVSKANASCDRLIKRLQQYTTDSWKTAYEVEREERRWIPVTERLPKIHTMVLVMDKAHDMAVGSLEKLWDGEVWVCPFADVEDEQCPITHWMPLPEPPKDNES